MTISKVILHYFHLQDILIHQDEFFVFHTTLIELQKILETIEAGPEVRPLLKRTMANNLALIKLLFRYLIKSGKKPDKRIAIEDTNQFWKHYKPLKEVFEFL